MLSLRFLLLCLFLIVHPWAFSWSSDPTTATAIFQSTGTISNILSFSDGAGGKILVWNDSQPTRGLYAQRVSKTGMPQWGSTGVFVGPSTVYYNSSSLDSHQSAASDGNGGLLAACTQDDGIYVYRLNAQGKHLWTKTGVRLSTSSATIVSVVDDSAGGMYVCWPDERHGTLDVFAQRVTGAGEVLWGAGVEVCTELGSQTWPRLVSKGSNGCWVVWEDGRNVTTKSLFCQFVSSAGTHTFDRSGLLVGTSSKTVTNSLMCPDDAGGIYVLWESGNFDLVLQRIDANGHARFETNGRIVASPGDHPYQKISGDGTGGVVVAWRHGYIGHVRAQRVSADGTALWTEGGENVSVESGTRNPDIVSDGGGGAVVVWHRLDTIYAQKLSSAGQYQWTQSGVPVYGAVSQQAAPVITTDEFGGYIVAFRRGGLYASRLTSDGQLGFNSNVEDWQLF